MVELALRIKVEPFQNYVKLQEAAPACGQQESTTSMA